MLVYSLWEFDMSKVDWTNLIRIIHENGLDDRINVDILSFSDLELDQIEDMLQGVLDTIKDERAERNYITDRASDKLFFGV